MVFVVLLSVNSYAKDLGVVGANWDIEEEGFVHMMESRLSKVNVNELQEQFKKKVEKSFSNPKSGAAMGKATQTVSHIVDPTYTVEKDIILPDGKVMYYAGHKINPLDYITLDKKLVFIDFDDKASVEWVEKLDFDHEVILVSGNIVEAQGVLGSVYFDQFGQFVKKFGIKNVPAILESVDKMIKITEVRVD